MSGTYEPIAGISDTDHGPVITMVSIFLIVTTLLIFGVRGYVSRWKRLTDLDSDEAIFAIGVVLAVAMSLISQQMVPAGLGKHKATLSFDQLDQFYRLHYASQFLSILCMAFAKLSLVLMFNRIVPTQAHLTFRLLMPMIFAYTVSGLFLVAFQCQLPEPWLLDPLSCSTRGRVHFATAALNTVTDAIVSVWIVPTIWNLQMPRGSKAVVIALLMSRLVVCAVDVGRIYIIGLSLQSADSTWSFLGWAVMDQVVVHLSLNHVSLPRIHVFLRNLQTGNSTSRITAHVTSFVATYGSGHTKRALPESKDDTLPTSTVSEPKEGHKSRRSGFPSRFRPQASKNPQSVHEDQLRLEPDYATEMATFVTGGDGESTSSTGNMDASEKRRSYEGWGEVRGDRNHIKVVETVEVMSELRHEDRQ